MTTRPTGSHAIQRTLRLVAVVFTVAAYALVALMGWVFFYVLIAVWRRNPRARTLRIQRCIGFGYRFMHDWLRWVRVASFDFREVSFDVPAGPCIVIANHPTQLDVTSIGALLAGGCTVVKSEVYRKPILKPLMVGGGLLEGPRGDPVSVGRVIEDGLARLRDGMRIFVFPEGKRSPPGGLRPFGRVAFEIACRANVPVVCIGIRCEPPWLTHEVPLFRPPHPMPEVRLSLLATLDPAVSKGDSRALRDRVERLYRDWLGLPPS